MTRFWDGRTEEQTDGLTRLLDLLSPLGMQVKTLKYILINEVQYIVMWFCARRLQRKKYTECSFKGLFKELNCIIRI